MKYAWWLVLAMAGATLGAENTLSLAGQWRFQLDREDKGIQEGWFNKTLPQTIQLPGSLTAQGYGDDVTVETKWMGNIVDRAYFTDPFYAPYRRPGNIKVPFWLQPDKYYSGVAWYQRDVEIPEAWRGKRVIIHLERAHWGTQAWVDGQLLGSRDSLATPHEYDASKALTPGRHQLTIRVDNRYLVEVGIDAHSVSDHTQGNWNGIIGALKIVASDSSWVDDVQVYPELSRRAVKIAVVIGSLEDAEGSGTLEIKAVPLPPTTAPAVTLPKSAVKWRKGENRIELDYPLWPQAALWDEFQPSLYRLEVALEGNVSGRQVRHQRELTFGLREVGRQGTQIAINGRKIFLRGTLECNIFPLTGYPPTEVEPWKRIIQICKAHGLNHIRFHSHCPPEAAFQAADELGFYYYVECPSWANSGSTVGDGRPLDAWLYAEAGRILRAYGNHPSFIMMSYGNEPAGKNQNRWLGDWVMHWKSRDARRLYTSGAGWPMIKENDFHVTPTPRIQAWGAGLNSRINARPPETVTDYRDFIQKAGAPVVSHEIGQWCVYPNFDEIPKYTGLLKARNFEIFRDSLQARGMLGQARDFLLASGKLQALCYKEDIESALRTPGMAGFELLDLHDFPGQGTALVGVLDPFWDSKGYITAEEFRRFSGQTVPLARMKRRIFLEQDEFSAQIEVAHYGPANLPPVAAVWKLRRPDGTVFRTGTLPARPVPTGTLTALGEITVPLVNSAPPTKLNLEVQVGNFANDWDIWVYPNNVSPLESTEVHIAEALDDKAMAELQKGGKVLLLAEPARIKGDKLGRVKIGFSSIFWNTAWTRRQPPHTLGILCDPKHPALKNFPTEYHSNWQWWELVSRSHPFIINDTPQALKPIIQVIDDWVTNRKLALVFEAQVGRGKLLLCGIDLKKDLAQRPVARQLRASLINYMLSENFAPSIALEPDYVKSLLAPPSMTQKLGARVVRADSEAKGYEAAHILDDDPNTIWHTPWEGRVTQFPHEVVIAFDRPGEINGISLLPRQDKNRNGWIKTCAVFASEDGQNWGEPLARAEFKADAGEKQIKFPRPVTPRFLKLQALSTFDNAPYASLAELRVW